MSCRTRGFCAAKGIFTTFGDLRETSSSLTSFTTSSFCSSSLAPAVTLSTSELSCALFSASLVFSSSSGFSLAFLVFFITGLGVRLGCENRKCCQYNSKYLAAAAV